MTPRMIRLAETWSDLKVSKEQVMRPVGLFRKRYDAQAVIALTEAVAETNHKLWQEIYTTYPETKKGNWQASWSKSQGKIMSID